MTILANPAALTANTDNLVYTATGPCTISIFCWNSNTNAVQVKIGIVLNGHSVGAGSYIDGPMLSGLQPISREGIPLQAGDLVYVNPSSAGVNCGVVGVP